MTVTGRREAENTIFFLLGHPEQSPEHENTRSSLQQGRESMKNKTSYLGIDVSKRTLHLASPEKFLGEFDNTIAGHQNLIRHISELQPAGIVLEASGGYERLLFEALCTAGLKVTIAQPGCIRHFARSLKVLAKTDAIDAVVIARFAEATTPEPTPQTPAHVRKLRALCDRRSQVVEDRVRESNRLESCADPEMRRHLQNSIKRLQTHEQQLDQKITSLIASHSEFQQKQTIMTALKGIGPKTVCTLLAHLDELGTLTREQVAALAGLAPHPHESGSWSGKRRIYGGRAQVRRAMFMAAKSAAVWCPVISKFYQRLRANGKSYKVTIVACARKMLVRLNTLMKHLNESHQKNSPQIRHNQLDKQHSRFAWYDV